MPRLFTGIEIPEALQLRLSLLGAPLPGARWLHPENMHMTLCFAGDISERQADDWASELARIEMEAFDIWVSGLGSFGSKRPHVLWAGVETTGPSLEALHNAHLRAARLVGIDVDSRRFKPHVTLARLRGTRPEDVAAYIAANAALRFEPFKVERAVLFASKPGTGGGPYRIEDSYPLAQSYEAYDNDNFV